MVGIHLKIQLKIKICQLKLKFYNFTWKNYPSKKKTHSWLLAKQIIASLFEALLSTLLIDLAALRHMKGEEKAAPSGLMELDLNRWSLWCSEQRCCCVWSLRYKTICWCSNGIWKCKGRKCNAGVGGERQAALNKAHISGSSAWEPLSRRWMDGWMEYLLLRCHVCSYIFWVW